MSASMPEEIDKMKNIPYQSADVCNAGNLTWHILCSGSCQPILIKSRGDALESSQKGVLLP
jgi:hypothetical protein